MRRADAVVAGLALAASGCWVDNSAPPPWHRLPADPPELLVYEPQDGAVYVESEPIALRGHVRSGSEEAWVVWVSNIDGERASFHTDELSSTGEFESLALMSAGVHVLEVDATNDEGLRTVDTRQVYVMPVDPTEVTFVDAEAVAMVGEPQSLSVQATGRGVDVSWRVDGDDGSQVFLVGDWDPAQGDLNRATWTPLSSGQFAVVVTATDDFGQTAQAVLQVEAVEP